MEILYFKKFNMAQPFIICLRPRSSAHGFTNIVEVSFSHAGRIELFFQIHLFYLSDYNLLLQIF